DIKPENILINDAGDAKLTDFGVAAPVNQTLPVDQARELLGTIAYLAPEVIQGASADGRSDVYSLALSLYEAAAGRLPFSGSSAGAIAAQRLAGPPPPLRTFVPGASAGFEATLARALAMSPRDRLPGAAEFGSALGTARLPAAEVPPAAVGPPARPVPARRPTGPITVSRAPRRPPADGGNAGLVIAIVIAAIILALGAGGLLALILAQQDPDDGTPEPTPTVGATPATEEATDEPTVRPTDEPTATATEEPTETPTPEPTEEPTALPTATEEPTAEGGG
ncbi:MAG: protein kinase, partial [Dehalococcoidia bacterium]